MSACAGFNWAERSTVNSDGAGWEVEDARDNGGGSKKANKSARVRQPERVGH